MYFSIETVAAVAALLPITLAVPTITTSSDSLSSNTLRIVPGTTDQGSTSIQKRGYKNKVYGDHEGSVSSYPDGSGKFIRSDDIHTYASRDKCWTELWYVDQEDRNTEWVHQGNVECGTTSACDWGLEKGQETCIESSITIEAGLELTILEDILSASAGFSSTESTSRCDLVTTATHCTWDDKKCHAAWTSQTVKVNKGYIRRRCNYFGDDKGDTTRWSMDWEVQEKATGLSLGCNAECGAQSYTL